MTTSSTPLTWRECLLHAVLLILLLIPAFPGVFLRGEQASPADLLYTFTPWDQHTPPGFEKPK
ncbi:MAG: hypothetical protein JXR94_23080, partial [Candidatus Hydrogenedentes bacterium]|nr:hypothetical protein [Candidatus Hydrogenedentota bacterium]